MPSLNFLSKSRSSSSTKNPGSRGGSPLRFLHSNSSVDTIRGADAGGDSGSSLASGIEKLSLAQDQEGDCCAHAPYRNKRLANEPYDADPTGAYFNNNPNQLDPMLRSDVYPPPPPPPAALTSPRSGPAPRHHPHQPRHSSNSQRHHRSRTSAGGSGSVMLVPWQAVAHTFKPPARNGPTIERDPTFTITRAAADTLAIRPLKEDEIYKEIMERRTLVKDDHREPRRGLGPYQELIAPSLSERDVYRYRKQYGVNIRGWFSPEGGITGPIAGQHWYNDTGFIDDVGPPAEPYLENHFETWMGERDWAWLIEHGINTIRINVPYWVVSGIESRVVKGTPLEERSDPVQKYWIHLTVQIRVAETMGIGVLIVFDRLPGCPDFTRPEPQPINLFRYEYRKMTTKTLQTLAKLIYTHNNIVGLEILEKPPNHDLAVLQRWYESMIEQIRGALPFTESDEFPIYVNDAGDLDFFSKWVGSRQDWVVLTHRMEDDNLAPGSDYADVFDAIAKASHVTRGRLVISSWGLPDPTNVITPAGISNEHRTVIDTFVDKIMTAPVCGRYLTMYKTWEPQLRDSALDLVTYGILPEWLGGVIRVQPIETPSAVAQEQAIQAAQGLFETEYIEKHGTLERPRTRSNSSSSSKSSSSKSPTAKQEEPQYPSPSSMFKAGFTQGVADAIVFSTSGRPYGVSISELSPSSYPRARWYERRLEHYRNDLLEEVSEWPGFKSRELARDERKIVTVPQVLFNVPWEVTEPYELGVQRGFEKGLRLLKLVGGTSP